MTEDALLIVEQMRERAKPLSNMTAEGYCLHRSFFYAVLFLKHPVGLAFY